MNSEDWMSQPLIKSRDHRGEAGIENLIPGLTYECELPTVIQSLMTQTGSFPIPRRTTLRLPPTHFSLVKQDLTSVSSKQALLPLPNHGHP